VRPATAALLCALVTALRRIRLASPHAYADAIVPRLPSHVLRVLAAAAADHPAF
jgi:hypothetical protein